MTRKDYIAIAEAFRVQQPRPLWSASRHAQYTQDVRAIAEVLAADNPRFDYVRFYAAAGLVEPISKHEHSIACDCRQKTT